MLSLPVWAKTCGTTWSLFPFFPVSMLRLEWCSFFNTIILHFSKVFLRHEMMASLISEQEQAEKHSNQKKWHQSVLFYAIQNLDIMEIFSKYLLFAYYLNKLLLYTWVIKIYGHKYVHSVLFSAILIYPPWLQKLTEKVFP